MSGPIPKGMAGTPPAAGPRIAVEEALTSSQMVLVRDLFEAYARSLNVSLGFQGFDRELEGLPGHYARPGGRLLLGRVDGVVLGCGAVRPLEDGVCEMKRLYVRPEARGTGLGGALARRIIVEAREIGYRAMRLDTLAEMQAAQGLYGSLGFRPIANYNGNPLPGALFFELTLL
jgi:putative acetyltransferase